MLMKINLYKYQTSPNNHCHIYCPKTAHAGFNLWKSKDYRLNVIPKVLVQNSWLRNNIHWLFLWSFSVKFWLLARVWAWYSFRQLYKNLYKRLSMIQYIGMMNNKMISEQLACIKLYNEHMITIRYCEKRTRLRVSRWDSWLCENFSSRIKKNLMIQSLMQNYNS